MPENDIKDDSAQGAQNQDFETMYKASSGEAHRLNESNVALHTKLVTKDPEYLVELHGDNPKLAEKIAQAEYGIDYNTAKTQIEGHSISDGGGLDEEKIAQKVLSKIDKQAENKKAEGVVSKFYTENNIEGEFKKDFEEIYNELSDGKTLDSAKSKKFLDIAFREAKNTSKNLEEHQKATDQAKALGGAGKGDGGKTPRKEGRQILKEKGTPEGWY